MTIEELKQLKESGNKVEFKEARNGNYSFNGGGKADPKDRRKYIIGYVIAFANEGGGYLVFGMHDKHPHNVVGTSIFNDSIGKLEQDIYREKRIRVEVIELFEGEKRVLLIKIPSRPIGKVFKFEDVPLMRVGEELLPMSDEQFLKIIQEQEPDFSGKICNGATVDDLDELAIIKMKDAYAEKQKNEAFLTLSNLQALIDLNLVAGGKVTYAAIILLGKKEAIYKFLPQSGINIEYRNSITQIVFDNRQIFQENYFIAIDKIWDLIDLRNGKIPVQQGTYIFDIPFFNKEVIREALNNAVAHRDYTKSGEIVIKQYPTDMYILNPGGFPLGVNLGNLLTVVSTPRNRLLADVLAKTGVVERSGQGIDKIFLQSLSEAKPEPDYSRTDLFQVELRLSGFVEDKAFAIFIRKVQHSRKADERLGVEDVIALSKIRKGIAKTDLDLQVIKKLESEGLIERMGKTNSQKIILSKLYYTITGKEGEYSKEKPLEDYHIYILIIEHLNGFPKARMKDFVQVLNKFLTRDQVKYKIDLMVKNGTLEKFGKGSGTYYRKGDGRKRKTSSKSNGIRNRSNEKKG